jgi:MlaC protein
VIRLLLLVGVLALAAGGRARANEPEPAPPPLEDSSTPLVTVTVLLQTLNVDLCSAPTVTPSVLFDTVELARRALGRYHRDRTEAELAQFTDLFGLRFQQWYTGALGRIRDLRIVAGTTDGDWAVLPARTSRPGRDLVYRLHRADGRRWLVYDVEVNGRSRLGLFHVEYDRIILDEGYRALVARLREEVDREARSPLGCSAAVSGGDARPAAGPDRTGADPPARRRRR